MGKLEELKQLAKTKLNHSGTSISEERMEDVAYLSVIVETAKEKGVIDGSQGRKIMELAAELEFLEQREYN